MAEPPPPALRLCFDADALAGNWQALDRISGYAMAGAAVKADAYGIGVDRAVPVLREAGCRRFYVAHWSEVADVAQHVAAESISVLHGVQSSEEAAYARAIGARPVINSLKQARLWQETGGGACDLMVDTGINRLGLSMSEIGAPQIASLHVETLMSHLASADEDAALNGIQLARFREVCAAIPAKTRSFANSAGIALGPDYAFDETRPGLSLYGGIPRGELADVIRPVIHPQAAIMQRRSIRAGESVGYNARFIATEAMEIGVVALGYADGFLRCRGPGGAVMFDGQRLPILGTVSMDMIVIDATAAPQLADGDWVDIPFDLRENAQHSGLSQYELLTTLGRRFR